MKKILSLIIFIVFLIYAKPAFAADLNIECFGTGNCTKSGLNPLFSQPLDGYWLPGDSKSKTFKIINSYSETREVFIKPVRTSPFSILENVFQINMFPVLGSGPNWNGMLSNYYNLGNFSLGNISPGGSVEYTINASMMTQANNSYQNKSTTFNLNFTFWVEKPKNRSSISGFKYYDSNGNNKWDGWVKGEFRIDGWIIFIDKNNNKKYDWGERMDFTKGLNPLPLGNYYFDSLSVGNYSICEIKLPGFESSLTNHATCQQVVIKVNGENISGVNFGNRIISKKR
jgi:hypothetical protein